jgi:hypothetical protein
LNYQEIKQTRSIQEKLISNPDKAYQEALEISKSNRNEIDLKPSGSHSESNGTKAFYPNEHVNSGEGFKKERYQRTPKNLKPFK